MTIVAPTNDSHAESPSSPTLVEVVAPGTRMVGPDFLRSLAILLVMLVHLPLNATPGVLVTLREYSWLGVDIFFVLSGYLIGTQVFKEITRTGTVDFKTFYLRRAFRIFPAFFVVLALYVLFPVLRDSPSMQPLWKFATFTVNLGFDPREGNAFSQAWSLAVEEQFYLVLPLLVRVLNTPPLFQLDDKNGNILQGRPFQKHREFGPRFTSAVFVPCGRCAEDQ